MDYSPIIEFMNREKKRIKKEINKEIKNFILNSKYRDSLKEENYPVFNWNFK